MPVPTTAMGARYAPGRAKYLRRGVRTAAIGVLIAAILAALTDKDFWSTLVYSQCISLSCWIFIDTGRGALAAWFEGRARRAGTALPETGWPGWPAMIGVVFVGSLLGFSLGTALGNWLTGIRSPTLMDVSNVRGALSLLLLSLIPAIGVTYFFHSRGLIADQKAAVQEAQRQAAEHQLRLLQSQLQPHMLFNTLANLRVLIALDPPRAQAMLDQLIAFLRGTLSASRAVEHPLGDEFARLADYLALMQVRMGDRLALRLDLPDDLATVPVPPLLLQALVENSILHGLEPKVGGGRIHISARREAGDIEISVRDTGVGLTDAPSGGTGFGVSQVRERLATRYGHRASFVVAPATDAEGGTLAVIRLPLGA